MIQITPTRHQDSQPATVLDTVVPNVETYLRDFGLTDASFVAIEARILVGRAMMQTAGDASHEEILSFALAEAFAKKSEWEYVARREAMQPLWSGAEAVPGEKRQAMPRQRLQRPGAARRRVPRPAVT